MRREDREHEYPIGSLGWKINRIIDAIEAKALKNGIVLLFISTILLSIFFVEAVLHPFLLWREVIDLYPLTTWHRALYGATLFLFGSAFLYWGVRLFWNGRKRRIY